MKISSLTFAHFMFGVFLVAMILAIVFGCYFMIKDEMSFPMSPSYPVKVYRDGDNLIIVLPPEFPNVEIRTDKQELEK